MNTNLALIVLAGAEHYGKKVNEVLMNWNNSKKGYIIDTSCPRFGSGEGKGLLKESIRDKDVYILTDVCNYSITYKLCGIENHMSPDDHYQDLKRMIAACSGKAKRITVIMPFLYESRQHKRSTRESLDCAVMLQELMNMGVTDIITFDAHDPRMQNAIPLNSLENVSPSFQFTQTLLNKTSINIGTDVLSVVSPDEGATSRAMYLANMYGVDMGMFYKRRDYTKIIDGRNPIIAHEFLGSDIKDKDVIVIDDMISSGDSMIDVAKQLKQRGAKNIYVLATFGLFTNGLNIFDDAVNNGYIHKVLTTNLIYQKPELLQKEWYISVEMEEYISALIASLNKGESISSLITPSLRIEKLLKELT